MNGGYGVVIFRRKQVIVTRAVWEYHNGPIPAGMVICHHCDNPPCCRLDHLFLGTIADNNLDKLAKGRGNSRVGEHHAQHKLSDLDVAAIRERHAGGETAASLASEFNITATYVLLLAKGQRRTQPTPYLFRELR